MRRERHCGPKTQRSMGAREIMNGWPQGGAGRYGKRKDNKMMNGTTEAKQTVESDGDGETNIKEKKKK